MAIWMCPPAAGQIHSYTHGRHYRVGFTSLFEAATRKLSPG